MYTGTQDAFLGIAHIWLYETVSMKIEEKQGRTFVTVITRSQEKFEPYNKQSKEKTITTTKLLDQVAAQQGLRKPKKYG